MKRYMVPVLYHLSAGKERVRVSTMACGIISSAN